MLVEKMTVGGTVMEVYQSGYLERTIIAGSIFLVLLLIKRFQLSALQSFIIGLAGGALGYKLFSFWRKKIEKSKKTDSH